MGNVCIGGILHGEVVEYVGQDFLAVKPMQPETKVLSHVKPADISPNEYDHYKHCLFTYRRSEGQNITVHQVYRCTDLSEKEAVRLFESIMRHAPDDFCSYYGGSHAKG